MNKKALLKKYVYEKNNALEGAFWPVQKRFNVMNELYYLLRQLNPYAKKAKPFVKSFDSFDDYEKWKRKQSPWFW